MLLFAVIAAKDLDSGGDLDIQVTLNVGYYRKIAASENIVHFSPTASDIQFSTIQSGLIYVTV